uniref:PRADC1-like protein n=1 Tax=Cacopsylla melanoneura TaxID=428564 RepID=A0A8D9ANU0_9HEMI
MTRSLIAIFILTLEIQHYNSDANFGANVHIVETALGTTEISGAENIYFEIIEPEELSYTFKIRPAKDFGSSFNSSYLGSSVRLVPTNPPWGCTHPINANSVRGHVALIERGECSFVYKATIAESIGARAVIISDNDPDSDDFYVEMIRDHSKRDINIPVAFLVGKNGRMIKSALKGLQMDYALINIPLNLTYVPIHKINQPPWMKI